MSQYYACVDRQSQQQQQTEQQNNSVSQPPAPDSQSIYQPVNSLRQDLNTPGPKVSPPEDLDKPAVITVSTKPDTKYLEFKDIKKGDTISSSVNQKINILTGDGKIDLREGSTLKYISEGVWQAVKGAFHFVYQHLPKRKIEVKTPKAVLAVRGTQFTVNVNDDGNTVVSVTKDVVSVTPNNSKKSIDVKEGFQLTLDKNALGKPVKINTASLDNWYEVLPAGSDFLASSWTKVAAINSYRQECVYKAGNAVAAQSLTADEEKIVQSLNQSLAKFRVKIINAFVGTEKKIFTSKETTRASGKIGAQIYIDSKGIYYPADKTGGWKVFQDKAMSDSIFKAVRDENLTYGIDKNTLTFEKWSGSGKNRLAVFSGKLTTNGTNDVIKAATSQNQETGQAVGSVKLYIDEESQLLTKIEANVSTKSGKVIFPLNETCQVAFGDTVKITAPGKAKKINAKTGAVEFGNALNNF